jgi:hypothetical protein
VTLWYEKPEDKEKKERKGMKRKNSLGLFEKEKNR